MDLLVIDVSLKDGKGHVVLADQAHDSRSASLITLEFPLAEDVDGPHRKREERIAHDAQSVLDAAREALDKL